MRRFRGQSPLFYIIIGLLGIGVLSMIVNNPGAAVIPILVFGVVFLLYKFPPQRWRMMSRRMGTPRMSRGDARGKEKHAKRAKFRVIPGYKRDDDDDPGQMPKYH